MTRIQKKTIGALICGSLIWGASGLQAQYVKEYNPWPVKIGTETLALPFWGGINSPKPALVDFDHDGLYDLFIGEAHGKVSYLKNTGTARLPQWTPITERLGGVNTGSWFRLVDIDADGDLDLFCDSRTGFTSFYRNESVGDALDFTLVDSFFGAFRTGFNNTPDFADIDGDGDQDFFLGNQSGFLDLYRNHGSASEPSFVFETSAYDSVLAFPRGGLGRNSSDQAGQHGFSTISFGDLNSDNVIDLFYGDINNRNLYYFENFGTATNSDLTFQTENFLSFFTRGLNHVALADLDNDEDPDMLVGAANTDDIDNLIYLENVGSPSSPSLVIRTRNMIRNIDVGTASVPTLGDIDGDGDLDLFIGGQNGRLSLFENTGSVNSPRFELVSDFFDSIDVGAALAPELVDWDADGDLDLLTSAVANVEFRIVSVVKLWINIGSKTNFSLASSGVNLTASDGTVINVDSDAIPRTADMNGDGKFDLLVGEFDFNGRANILLYENIGSPQSPELQLVTRSLIRRDGFTFFRLPQVIDWDGDGRKDLLVGGLEIGMTLYRNLSASGQFPDSLTLIRQPALLPGSDDGARLSPSFVDIDGDDDLDMFLGEEDGGLGFYRNTGYNFTRGDFDGFPGVGETDVVYLINFLLFGGPPPQPAIQAADVNCSGSIDLVDIIALLMYVFASGEAPCAN